MLIVGAGISGVGGAYHLTKQCPGHELRRARDRRRASAAPGSRTAIPASAPTATSTPSATASSPGPARRSPPPPRSCSYMGEVIEENDLGRHIRYRHRIDRAALVERGQSLDHRGHAHATPARRSASPPASCGCARATTATRRATRRSGRAWPTSRAASSTRRPGRRTSTTRASSVVVIGSGATAATLIPAIARRLRARHHAAALADLLPHRPQRHRHRRRAAPSSRSTRPGSTRSSAARSSTIRATFTQRCVRRAGDGQAGAARPACAPTSARTTTSTRTSRRATGPGGSASPSCRTATCSRASPRARPRW